jgi:uncharacterized protein YbaA (DUF1428 family)
MAIATVPSVTDPRELALLKAVGLDRVSPEQRELAINIAKRYDLDLMLKHLVIIDGRPFITRDALIHIAHRSGQFDGIQTTRPEVVDDEWKCTATVWRKDMGHPFEYDGRYPTKGGNQKFAPEMCIKVAESMALRRAFDVAAPVVEERWDTAVPVADATPKPSLAEIAARKTAEIQSHVYRDQQIRDQEAAAEPVMSAPMSEEESDAMPYDEEAETPAEPALSAAMFAEYARRSEVRKVVIAGALDVTPDKVTESVRAMDDAGRYRLAQSLGIVP